MHNDNPELLEIPVPVIACVGEIELHDEIQKSMPFLENNIQLSGKEARVLKLISFEMGKSFQMKKKKDPLVQESTQGIIKIGWIQKHMIGCPSCVAYFFNWDDIKSDYDNKENWLISKLESSKKAFVDRNIFFIIILVSKSKGDFKTDDTHNLKKRLKNSFEDHFPQIIINYCIEDPGNFFLDFQNACIEMSDKHFIHLLKYQAKKREGFNKNDQQSQLIRSHFKSLFYNEVIGNLDQAIKDADLATKYLIEMSNEKSNISEIRVVAEIINFKICKLILSNSKEQSHLKSMKKFNMFIKSFKRDMGEPKRLFEHWSWVSRQYILFAELLKFGGFNGKQLGTYYVSAAEMTKKRKNAFQKVLIINPLDNETIQKYEGQLPHNLSKINFNRQRYIGEELMDNEHPLEFDSNTNNTNNSNDFQQEEKNTEALSREHNIKHSQLIVSLYKESLNYFKEFSSHFPSSSVSVHHAPPQVGLDGSRKKDEVDSYIAAEYFSDAKFNEAVEIYDNLIPKLFKERWYPVVSSSLKYALESAKFLNKKDSWVKFAMIALHPSVPHDNKKELQQSVMDIFSKDLDNNDQLNAHITIDNQQDIPIINSAFKFTKQKFYCSEEISCQVKLVSNLPIPIRFQELFVLFDHKEISLNVIDPLLCSDVEKNLNPNSLLLFPGVPTLLSFSLSVKQMLELSCVSLVLRLAKNQSFFVDLAWDVTSWPKVSENERKALELYHSSSFVNRTKTQVLQHAPSLQMKVFPPKNCFIGCITTVKLELLNNSDKNEDVIKEGLVQCVSPNKDDKVEIYDSPHKSTAKIKSKDFHKLETLKPKESITLFCYIKFRYATSYHLTFLCDYSCEGYSTSVSVDFNTIATIPFSFHLQTYDRVLKCTSKDFTDTIESEKSEMLRVTPDECFFIRTNISVNSESAEIECFGASLGLSEECQNDFSVNYNETKTPPAILTYNNKYTAWTSMSPKLTNKTYENWGRINVFWRLKENNNNSVVVDNKDQQVSQQQPPNQEHSHLFSSTVLPNRDDFFCYRHLLPPIRVGLSDFEVDFDYPSFGTVFVPFPLKITITNNTKQAEEISSHLKLKVINDLFLVEGTVEDRFKILPSSSKVLHFVVHPLKPGNFYLPSFVFKFVGARSGSKVADIIRYQIFIHP